MARAPGTHQIIALLGADPDLATGIDEAQLPAARRRAVAPVIEIEPPSWDTRPIRADAHEGWLGLFVLEGLMLRRVSVGKRAACELFGPGDLFRPWDTDGDYDPLPVAVDWLVLKHTRLAALDDGFVLRTAPWPTINSRIVGRVAQRARYLTLTQAVTHLHRAKARLLILFWLLAERWGTVTREGVYVELPVTHEVLAMLVGAHRPTVTIALQRLTRADFLIRERTDRWLLTRQAIDSLGKPDSLAVIDDEDRDEAVAG
jgi:CRP/FNR family transcriptional regulator, cyclic AMP receptor protein